MDKQEKIPTSLHEILQLVVDELCKDMKLEVDPSFKLSSFSRQILLQRYVKRTRSGEILEEIPADVFLRVAKCAAAVTLVYDKVKLKNVAGQSDVVKTYLFDEIGAKIAASWLEDKETAEKYKSDVKKFFDLFHSKLFCPAGRSLNTFKPIVANCVVLIPQDSLYEDKDPYVDCDKEGFDIYHTLSHAAILQSNGSGVGYSFDKLRPHAEPTSRGEAGGPVEFIKLFDDSNRVIKQHSRHGANMAVLSVNHPEFLEFMRCKKGEGSIKHFNISVGITHEFMRQATHEEYFDKPWVCKWKEGAEEMYPYYIVRQEDVVTDKNGNKINLLGNDAKTTVAEHYEPKWSARRILEEIAKMAHRNGEPGVVYIDTVNDSNPLPELGRILSCNPCVSKDTWVMTSEGPRQVSDLLDEPFKAVVDGKIYDSTPFFETGFKRLYEVCTEEGLKVKTTKKHRFSVPDSREWVPLSELKVGDKVNYIKYENINRSKCGKIVSITPLEKETVYDCTVDKVHAFDGNGFKLHNCGEQFLHDGDVCNLGAINLSEFVQKGPPCIIKDKNGNKKVTHKCMVNVVKLRQVAAVAVEFLDNIIDLSRFPIKRVKHMQEGNRRIGLGVMGFANMLYKMEIPYNSEEARNIARLCMKNIKEAGAIKSSELAQVRGNFPNFEKSIFSKKHGGEGIPRRNAAITNVAPTGTTSALLDVSGGCEPFYALFYKYDKSVVLTGMTEKHKRIFLDAVKKSMERSGQQDENFNMDMVVGLRSELVDALKKCGVYSQELIEKIQQEGSISKFEEIPEKIRKVFCTSMDISPEDHVLMQAAFQEYCDNAISKTVNMPEEATVEDIIRVYILAYEKKCKGCTVYRNNSRMVQVVNLKKDIEVKDKSESSTADNVAYGEIYAKMEEKKKDFLKLSAEETGSPYCSRGSCE